MLAITERTHFLIRVSSDTWRLSKSPPCTNLALPMRMQIPLPAAVFGCKSRVAERRSLVTIRAFVLPSKALCQAIEEFRTSMIAVIRPDCSAMNSFWDVPPDLRRPGSAFGHRLRWRATAWLGKLGVGGPKQHLIRPACCPYRR